MPQTTSANAINVPFVDLKTGMVTWTWIQIIRIWEQQLSQGFDPSGNLKSNLLPSIGIVGRGGNIGSILQHIADNGVVLSSGLPAATDVEQGAVFLWAGAVSNHLGSAAGQPATAFDPAGSGSSAETNAKTYADAAAHAAQSNAEAFASNAANITSGLLDPNRLGGFTGTIVTAALTSLGSQGSMTFQNGLLMSQVAAT